MTQQVTFESRFENQINGGDVSWIVIPMKHRGKDYYLQFFQGSPWAYLTRPSRGLRRSMVVTILKMNDLQEGYHLFNPCLKAFRLHMKRSGFTDRIRYLPVREISDEGFWCNVDLGSEFISSYRKHFIARDDIRFCYKRFGESLVLCSQNPL